MCTYNITIDDTLMSQVRPTLGSDSDVAEWVQKQVELVMRNHLRKVARTDTKHKSTIQRIEKLAAAQTVSLRDLEGILPETNVSFDDLRSEYISDKYGI